MGHIPYGYKIENGQAILDSISAPQVRAFFDNYILGNSLTDSAKNAGFTILHGGASRILNNKHYLGDDFYPQLISEDVFLKAKNEQLKRAKKLGRIYEKEPQSTPLFAPTTFDIQTIVKHYSDPFAQAEYIYSLIEKVVD